MNLNVDISKFVSFKNNGNFAVEFDSAGVFIYDLKVYSSVSGADYKQVSFDYGETWNNVLSNLAEVDRQFILIDIGDSLERSNELLSDFLKIPLSRELSSEVRNKLNNRDITFCNIKIKEGLGKVLDHHGINHLTFTSFDRQLDVVEGNNLIAIIHGRISSTKEVIDFLEGR